MLGRGSSPRLKPGGSTAKEFADLLGRFPRQAGVALVHWNPDCAFCELLAPDLAQFQADLRTSNVQLVLASPEDAESNRELALEHGLTCPILLMPDDGLAGPGDFQGPGHAGRVPAG